MGPFHLYMYSRAEIKSTRKLASPQKHLHHHRNGIINPSHIYKLIFDLVLVGFLFLECLSRHQHQHHHHWKLRRKKTVRLLIRSSVVCSRSLWISTTNLLRKKKKEKKWNEKKERDRESREHSRAKLSWMDIWTTGGWTLKYVYARVSCQYKW